MNNNHVKLLNYLLKKVKPVTAQELADYLDVSVRTIKNYISFINKDAKETIVTSSVRGYEANVKNIYQYLNSCDQDENRLPQSYTERANYINKRFLMVHVNVLNIYDLSEEIFVSVQTLKLDIQKMNKSFANFEAYYEIHSDNVYLVADEKSLRKLARFTLFDHHSQNILDYSLLKNIFVDIDIDALRVAVKETLDEFNFYANDFSLLNIALHLSIIIMRIKNGNTLSSKLKEDFDKTYIEHTATEFLSSKLSKVFAISFSQDEKDNVLLLIKANTNTMLFSTQENIAKYVGESFIQFTRKLVSKLNSQYYMDLKNENFISLLSLHFKNLLFRSNSQQLSIDPMNDVIRYSYPLIFDMAVYASLLFEEEFHTKIDESEISYIALHIGGEMERQAKNQDKVKALLLCPNYLDFDIKMQKQIMVNFDTELELLAFVGEPEKVTEYSFDLLITAIGLDNYYKEYEIVEVPLLGIENSKVKIEEAIGRIKEKKQSYVLKNNFDRFFTEDLFLVDNNVNLTKEKGMQLAAKKMVRKGVVQDDFYEKLLERDRASSTGFANIAIPHSINMDAIKTNVCVMICPQGIQWGEQNVKIVLTIAIHKSDRNLFRELYQSLIQLFSDDKNIRLLVKSQTFEEFKETVFSLL